MSIAQRLNQLAEYEGSQAKLARKAGIKSQVISRIINKNTGVRSDTLEMLANAYPNLNLRWLVTGSGEMWNKKKEGTPISKEPDPQEKLKDEIITLQRDQLSMLKETVKNQAPDLAKRLGW